MCAHEGRNMRYEVNVKLVSVMATERQRALLSGCELVRARRAVWPVLDAHNVAWRNVVAQDRRAPMVRLRWEVYEALRKAGMSLPLIGRIVKRDHTTILHGLRALEARREYDNRRAQREAEDARGVCAPRVRVTAPQERNARNA